MYSESVLMSQKEQTISNLVMSLAGAGFLIGTVVGAVSVFRSSGQAGIVVGVEGLFLVMAFLLPVALVFAAARNWRSWQAMLRADAAETVGLMIGIGAFGSTLAMAAFVLPVVAFAYLLRRVGPWDLLPDVYAALAWQQFGIVLLVTTATATLLGAYLHQSSQN